MPLQLEDRDLRLLAHIGELGLLDAETIRARYWPNTKSPRACQKRLKILTEQGLLKPIRLEVMYRATPQPKDGSDQATKQNGKPTGGRLPTIYVLTEHGADTIETCTGERPRRVSRSDPKPLTLWHRLDVVRVRLAIDDAARLAEIPTPVWIMEQDAHPETAVGDSPSKRLILHETFAHCSCRPDASCHLRLPSHSPSRSYDELIVYLELDHSTNSDKRETKKLAGYERLLKEQVFRRHWPDAEQPTVRIFYVCPSDERIRYLTAAFAGEAVAGYVRFAILPEVVPERTLTDAIWQTIDGELKSILPPKQ